MYVAHLATSYSLMAGCVLHLFVRPCFLIPSSAAICLFLMLSPARLLLYLLMFYRPIFTICAFSLASFHPTALLSVYPFMSTPSVPSGSLGSSSYLCAYARACSQMRMIRAK